MKISTARCAVVVHLAVATLLTLTAGLAHAQTYQVIHNFAGGLDGSEPTSGVTMDAAGNLYGTTFEGDALTGTVYRLVHKSNSWVLMPLYLFMQAGSNGAIPYARVMIGQDGTLYGTTAFGGISQNCPSGCGIVFNLKPTPNPPITPLSPWLETPLYRFGGGSDGANPYGADIIFDEAGNIYGTTYNGGNGTCSGGCGVVYKLMRSNGSWTESVLYSFTQSGDAQHPWGGVTFDQSGNLYGTTVYGGAYGNGAIYQLKPSGGGWTESVLYSFTGGPDGANPYAGLTLDQAGNLYGATGAGGSGNGGTVFELSPSGGSWKFNLLYTFAGVNGQFVPGPIANLTFDAAGNLYGTTHGDGTYNFGAVFKLNPGGGGWSYTSLHDFTGGNDGGYPRSNVTFDKNGNMYGTAAQGGTGDSGNCYGPCGVIWEITP